MLCMSRRAAGKPALAIAWGPVDHVGYVAEILKVPVTLLLDSAAPDPAQACMLTNLLPYDMCCPDREMAPVEESAGMEGIYMCAWLRGWCWWEQGKLVGRVFEWLLPQPVDDCLRVLSSCLLGGKSVTPLMCSTSETIGSNSADDGEDTVSCPFNVIAKVSLNRSGEAMTHMCSNCSCSRHSGQCVFQLQSCSRHAWKELRN